MACGKEGGIVDYPGHSARLYSATGKRNIAD